MSWDDSNDYSDGFWVSLGTSGARADPSWTKRNIDTNFDGATAVYAIDVDGDGDIDVLGAADTANDITWWENDGSPSNGGWTEHTVDGSFNTARDIHAIDLDKDGDIDILGASAGADEVVWWENSGSESFTERTIDSDFSSAYAIQAVDVDNDGDIDVIGAANGNNVNYDISWWENDGNPSDGGWTRNVIDSTFDKARAVFATDMDNDGDIDVVGASYGDNDISWWENDGSESFTERSIDSTYSNANSVYATDVDQDGDIDVLGMSRGGDEVTLWKNDATGKPSGNWGIDEFDGYPALPDKIKSTVLGAADLKINAPKTALPRLYHRLGVEGPEFEDTTSLLLTLADSNKNKIIEVIVGKPRLSSSAKNTSGLYVREPEKEKSYLVNGVLNISAIKTK